MKIFEKDGKTNFVDDNNVFVGFDNGQSCCEHFGYSVTKKYPEKSGDDNDQSSKIDLDGFNFDKEYFKTIHGTTNVGYDENNVVFRLVKGSDEIFLTLFNHHNGYYSHGFTVKVGGEVILCDYL